MSDGNVWIDVMLTAAFIGFGWYVLRRHAPRCPECGSLWVTHLRGLPFHVCERCQAVWRFQ
jgi:hypothetical protein